MRIRLYRFRELVSRDLVTVLNTSTETFNAARLIHNDDPGHARHADIPPLTAGNVNQCMTVPFILGSQSSFVALSY